MVAPSTTAISLAAWVNLTAGGRMSETVITISSYLFLAGVLLVFSTIFPVVRERFPKALMVGFMLAVGSIFLVLFAATVLR